MVILRQCWMCSVHGYPFEPWQQTNRLISKIPHCIIQIPTMHHFVTEMCTNVHISLWYMGLACCGIHCTGTIGATSPPPESESYSHCTKCISQNVVYMCSLLPAQIWNSTSKYEFISIVHFHFIPFEIKTTITFSSVYAWVQYAYSCHNNNVFIFYQKMPGWTGFKIKIQV